MQTAEEIEAARVKKVAMINGRRKFRKDVMKRCALLKDAKTVAMKRHYHGQVTNDINRSKEGKLTNDCRHTYYLWNDKGYGKTKDWEAFLSGTEALKIYLEFKAVMELADKEKAVKLAAQEEQPRQPTASASDDANAPMATMLTRMEALLAANMAANADIEALRIQIGAVNTPAATGSAATAAASNSGNIDDNADDDDDDDDDINDFDIDIDINNVDSNQKKRKRSDDEKADDDEDDGVTGGGGLFLLFNRRTTRQVKTKGQEKRRKKEQKRKKEDGVTGGGGVGDDGTTTGASVVGGEGGDTYVDINVDDTAVAAAVAAATLTNNDNNNENNSNNNSNNNNNRNNNNKNDDNNSNQNDNNGMDNDEQQQQQQQFQQPQPDGVVSNGVEQAEQQQQQRLNNGDRVIFMGFGLNGKQGIVESVLRTSPSRNQRNSDMMSEMTDDDKRNAIWYNIFLETDVYIEFPSTYLRDKICVDNGSFDNEILAMMRANPVANDGDTAAAVADVDDDEQKEDIEDTDDDNDDLKVDDDDDAAAIKTIDDGGDDDGKTKYIKKQDSNWKEMFHRLISYKN